MEIVFVNGQHYYEIFAKEVRYVELAMNLLREILSNGDKTRELVFVDIYNLHTTSYKLDKTFKVTDALEKLKPFFDKIEIVKDYNGVGQFFGIEDFYN